MGLRIRPAPLIIHHMEWLVAHTSELKNAWKTDGRGPALDTEIRGQLVAKGHMTRSGALTVKGEGELLRRMDSERRSVGGLSPDAAQAIRVDTTRAGGSVAGSCRNLRRVSNGDPRANWGKVRQAREDFFTAVTSAAPGADEDTAWEIYEYLRGQ